MMQVFLKNINFFSKNTLFPHNRDKREVPHLES